MTSDAAANLSWTKELRAWKGSCHSHMSVTSWVEPNALKKLFFLFIYLIKKKEKRQIDKLVWDPFKS